MHENIHKVCTIQICIVSIRGSANKQQECSINACECNFSAKEACILHAASLFPFFDWPSLCACVAGAQHTGMPSKLLYFHSISQRGSVGGGSMSKGEMLFLRLLDFGLFQ